MTQKRNRLFRNLPLFWKVLVPFLTLMVLVGAFGVLLIVRDLSSRAQVALDQDLSRRSLDARTFLRDRELYLLESANFAANVEGMAGAIKAKDGAAVGRLLQSVLALKTDLNLVAATDSAGSGLVEFARASSSEPPSFGKGLRWSDYPFVVQALGESEGNKSSGFLTAGGKMMLGIAAPVCSVTEGCAPVGAAIVGIGVDELAASARGKPAPADSKAAAAQSGVAIYDLEGRLLARVGLSPKADKLPDDIAVGKVPSRLTHRIGSTEVGSFYAPLEIQGSRAGTLGVSVPTGPALATARSAGVRLALIVLVAMGGIVALGAMLSRYIVAQLNPLVDTNRALGEGDLSARAPVFGEDELGELARGVNQMAEQLEASYETLELRVAQRTEEVQRLLKERTEFFAALSHEFRTPLAVILREAEMMRNPSYRKNRASPAQTGKAIDKSAQQLLSLVNDVLDLARAEAGRIEVNLEKVDVAEVVKDTRHTIEGLAHANGLKIGINVARDLPSVKADRARLREILLNLVDNAVKYTPEGGKIELSAAAQNGEVKVSVSDTGVGIPPEAGELIFEPFYRVPGIAAQRGQASSGLGLAIAKRLVEAQGGSLSFSSEPEVGSTFTFSLKPVKSRPQRIETRVNRGGKPRPR